MGDATVGAREPVTTNLPRYNPPFDWPTSLAEVARRAGDPEGSFWTEIRDFLRAFYCEEDPTIHQAMIADEPAAAGTVEDAYLGAVAEHLSIHWDLDVPDWSWQPNRFLHRPWFAGPDSFKVMLLVEAPAAFRRRMLFVPASTIRW